MNLLLETPFADTLDGSGFAREAFSTGRDVTAELEALNGSPCRWTHSEQAGSDLFVCSTDAGKTAFERDETGRLRFLPAFPFRLAAWPVDLSRFPALVRVVSLSYEETQKQGDGDLHLRLCLENIGKASYAGMWVQAWLKDASGAVRTVSARGARKPLAPSDWRCFTAPFSKVPEFSSEQPLTVSFSVLAKRDETMILQALALWELHDSARAGRVVKSRVLLKGEPTKDERGNVRPSSVLARTHYLRNESVQVELPDGTTQWVNRKRVLAVFPDGLPDLPETFLSTWKAALVEPPTNGDASPELVHAEVAGADTVKAVVAQTVQGEVRLRVVRFRLDEGQGAWRLDAEGTETDTALDKENAATPPKPSDTP